MEKKETLQRLGERKKMFEEYLAQIRMQPRLRVHKYQPCGINTRKKT